MTHNLFGRLLDSQNWESLRTTSRWSTVAEVSRYSEIGIIYAPTGQGTGPHPDRPQSRRLLSNEVSDFVFGGM